MMIPIMIMKNMRRLRVDNSDSEIDTNNKSINGFEAPPQPIMKGGCYKLMQL
jgi:hypothetical protein